MEDDSKRSECTNSSDYNLDDSTESVKPLHSNGNTGISRKDVNKEDLKQNQQNLFLPKITMVGLSTEETGQMSKASLKKTMEDLTNELEKTDLDNMAGDGGSNEFKVEDRDPLFVANVGDYYSNVGRTGTAGWIRGGSN